MVSDTPTSQGGKMKTNFKKAIVLLMVLAFTAGFVAPLKAEAAVKKVTAKTNFAKSPKVVTGKNYLVTAKKYDGELYYTQFTAPKKGTYVFTLKNLTKHGESTDDVIMNGCVNFEAFQYRSEKSPSPLKLKIGKETGYTLYLCSQYSWTLKTGDDIDIYSYLPERKVSLKMEKGATVYIAYNFIDKCDVELNIKKK